MSVTGTTTADLPHPLHQRRICPLSCGLGQECYLHTAAHIFRVQVLLHWPHRLQRVTAAHFRVSAHPALERTPQT